MKEQNTSKTHLNLFRRLIKSIKDGWRSYSKAVDMAYNRGHIHEDKMNPELCTGNNHNISAKAKSRPIKAAAFDDYTTY